MTAGFMLVTIEDVVLASRLKFLCVARGFACLDLFQSMLMKIMFAPTVLCSSGTVPRSVAADDVDADHADDIADAMKIKKIRTESRNGIGKLLELK